MKYVILLIDGAADFPVEQLQGRTPLMVADKPNIDRLAVEGRCGTLATVPEGITPDSAVANLSVLGYDPRTTYQGRGVLEAASLGVGLAAEDVAMRCNLICTAEGRIVDHSAGHIGNDEAAELIADLGDALGGDGVEFHPGISYRHLLVLRGGGFDPDLRCWPPHDHVGRRLADSCITSRSARAEATARRLNQLVDASTALLADHPVNRRRRQQGKREATTIWFWAPGRKPTMQTLQQRFGINGAVISAVDLIHGLGRYAGMTSIQVEGATGLYDTNYEGKARAAIDSLRTHDLVYVHVEGPDEAGHARDLETKVRCIEAIDRRLLSLMLDELDLDDTAIAVLPDHFTPVERGDHVGQPVPVLIRGANLDADDTIRYDEVSVSSGALGAMTGEDFIRTLLGRA